MCESKNKQQLKNYICEYNSLRKEIMDSIKLYNSLTTLTLTVVVAFLGYLISENSKSYSLYFMPTPIILAISLRTLYYRRKICQISAYMIVYLEPNIDGMNWETKNNVFENTPSTNNYDTDIFKTFNNLKIIKALHGMLKYARYTEFLSLILGCFIIYLYKIVYSIGSINPCIIFSSLSAKNYFVLISFLIALFLELIITIDMNQTSAYREKCVKQWLSMEFSDNV